MAPRPAGRAAARRRAGARPLRGVRGLHGTREIISRPAVWPVIIANALWAIASALLLVSGWVAPTALGYAFVIAQAVVVALLGELQYMGLRGACAGPWPQPDAAVARRSRGQARGGLSRARILSKEAARFPAMCARRGRRPPRGRGSP